MVTPRVPPEKRKKVGRPSTYLPLYAKQAREACQRMGATDADLAALFGVRIQTLYDWRAKYPEFADALKTGKAIADQRVERSLYQRAVGYDHPSEEIYFDRREPAPKKVGDPDKRVVRIPTQKHVPPDTVAQIFWLKNRQPEQWRDVRKLEQEMTVKHADRYSDDELAKIAFGEAGDQGNDDGTKEGEDTGARPEGQLN